MKKLIALSIALSTFLPLSVAVAQTTSSGSSNPVLTQAAIRKSAILTQAAGRKETAASKAAERKAESQETVMQNLQNRAIKEIDRRLEAMNRLITRISNIKKLSDAQKATLTTQVQTEITNLTNLKTKIQADTDIDTLRTDVKSIITSYRIYALLIPKIHIITAAESMLTATEKLSSAYTELNERVDSATVAGVDTTQMKTALATMQAKITDANTQINNAISTVSALTPTGYPGNISGLKTARSYLTAARKDIVDAFNAAKDVLHMLRQSSIPSSPTTAVPTIEATPTATVPPTTTP
ncbi:MAG: hypothetical protein Q8Q49_05565 [bacterium]|nr:hypothetical protein [bacterium]